MTSNPNSGLRAFRTWLGEAIARLGFGLHAYRIQLMKNGQAVEEAGLCLPDRPEVTLRVAEAISEFVGKSYPL